MVRYVNMTEVETEDVLSDNVYSQVYIICFSIADFAHEIKRFFKKLHKWRDTW